jgi:hypothetical protein
LKELVQAAGLAHPQDITAHHIVRRGNDHKVKSLARLILTPLRSGALLHDDLRQLPLIYQHSWPLASALSFAQLPLYQRRHPRVYWSSRTRALG